eukprot:gene231-808_t
MVSKVWFGFPGLAQAISSSATGNGENFPSKKILGVGDAFGMGQNIDMRETDMINAARVSVEVMNAMHVCEMMLNIARKAKNAVGEGIGRVQYLGVKPDLSVNPNDKCICWTNTFQSKVNVPTFYQAEESVAKKWIANNKMDAEIEPYSSIALSVLSEADIVLSDDAFLSTSSNQLLNVGKYCVLQKKTFCFHLKGMPPSQKSLQALNTLIDCIDILFIQENALTNLAKFLKIDYQGKSNKQIASSIQRFNAFDSTTQAPMVVVLTEFFCHPRCMPCFVALPSTVREFKIKPADRCDDKKGTSSAFVGAFLAALSLGMDLKECMYPAHQTAAHVAMRKGCTWSPDWRYGWFEEREE